MELPVLPSDAEKFSVRNEEGAKGVALTPKSDCVFAEVSNGANARINILASRADARDAEHEGGHSHL
jgi:hypothetical protein